MLMLRVGFAILANASFMQVGVEQQIEVFVTLYGYIGVTVPSYGVSLSLWQLVFTRVFTVFA